MTPNPPTGLRERKKARTRRLLVEVAIDLCERAGFDATTVDQIANTAEVAPRTFFRYFDSKLDAVMTQDDRDWFEDPLAARPLEERPIEAIRQVMAARLGELLRDDSLVLRQCKLAMTTPSLRPIARERLLVDRDRLVRAFAHRLGIDDGLQPHLLAGAVIAAIWTVIDWWIATGARSTQLPAMIDEALFALAIGLDRPGGGSPTPQSTA